MTRNFRSIKGVHFDQTSVAFHLSEVNSGASRHSRIGLLLLTFSLYISTGFIIGFFGATHGLGFLFSQEVRFLYSLVSLIIAVWLITAPWQSLKNNLLTLFISLFLAILITQLSITAFPEIFPTIFWITILLDSLLPLTITITGFFGIRFAIALIDISYYKPTAKLINIVGIITFIALASVGAKTNLSMLQIRNPDFVTSLTSNMKSFVILVGVLTSCLILFFSWLSNHIRNAPWSHTGFLRSLVLAVSCWKSTSFYDLDLSNIDFSNSNLPNTDLRARKLYRTCFQGVKGLERARVDSRYLDLELPKVQKLLTSGFSEDKDFSRLNLRGAYLQDADLSQFNLTDSELTGADLQGADLRDASLVHAQAMGVNFTNANLTGVCIKDWSVNSETLFTNVHCDYIYREVNDRGYPTDRFPADRNFEPREFESLYQEVGNVIELIFKEGVNWQAVAFTLQKLQIEDEGLGLELRGIEKRGDLWVVKVAHGELVSGADVERRLYPQIEEMQKLLAAKEQQINKLLGIASDQAEALKELSKKPFGNSFFITGSTITNLTGQGQIEYAEAAHQVRNIVASATNPSHMTTTAQSLINQLQNQEVAVTLKTQTEFIQQILLSEAQKDAVFQQFLLQQGQQIVSTMPESAITSAIVGAIAQLNSESSDNVI